MPFTSALHLLIDLHFLLGGLVLGLLGALLAWNTRGVMGWRLLWIPLGKYASTLLLLFPLAIACERWVEEWLGNAPLARLPWLWAGQVIVFGLLSALAEWPFFHRAVAGRAASSLVLSVRANALSLVLLVAAYLPVCEFGLLRHGGSSAPPLDPSIQVLYLREGTVFRRSPGGREERLLSGLSMGAESRLFARRGERGWELWLRGAGAERRILLDQVAPEGAEIPQQAALALHLKKTVGLMEPTLLECHGKPAGSAREETSDWALQVGRWPEEGLAMRSRTVEGGWRVALDTPLLSWRARCATRLPGELALFQMGPYLWMLDLANRRVECLGRGQGALVVIDGISAPIA